MTDTRHVCPNCGQPVSQVARFCVHCGHDLTVPQPTAEPRRVSWRAVEGLAIFPVSLILFGIALAIIAAFVRDKDVLTSAGVLAQEVALLVVTVFWVVVLHKQDVRALGLHKPSGSDIGAGVLAGLVGIVTSTVVTGLVTYVAEQVAGHPVSRPDQIPLERAHPTTLVLALVGISVIVFAPLAEEAFFRGFIYRGISRWAAPSTAIVVSAVIFGVVHVIPLVIPGVLAFGIILAWVAERRDSIVPGMIAHMMFNIFGFIFFANQSLVHVRF